MFNRFETTFPGKEVGVSEKIEKETNEKVNPSEADRGKTIEDCMNYWETMDLPDLPENWLDEGEPIENEKNSDKTTKLGPERVNHTETNESEKKGNPEDGVMTEEKPDVSENSDPIKNKQDGLRREKEVYEELKEKYPKEDGYSILAERYLRDKDGNIVKDPETGQARRLDYVVLDKDGNVVATVEVTSKTADKSEQMAKEDRIRDNGGNYIMDKEGNLHKIPDTVKTNIERRP